MANQLTHADMFKAYDFLKGNNVDGLSRDQVLLELFYQAGVKLSPDQLRRLCKNGDLKIDFQTKPPQRKKAPKNRSEDRAVVLAAAVTEMREQFDLLLENLGNQDIRYQHSPHIAKLLKQIVARSCVDSYSQREQRESILQLQSSLLED